MLEQNQAAGQADQRHPGEEDTGGDGGKSLTGEAGGRACGAQTRRGSWRDPGRHRQVANVHFYLRLTLEVV